ncbi:MAG: protein kinase [Gemmataceae bacterium]|nr:protein kinase [Gemmataceae bacterium]
MPAAVGAILDSVRDSGLVKASDLDALAAESADSLADSAALLKELVRRGWLTSFQAAEIEVGRVKDLTLGPYVLLDKLGAGGMGQVFKARHRIMDRVVAVKVVKQERLPGPEAAARFHREIRALASLSHPNIVIAHDAAQIGATHFFVMEYVEGCDLGRFVRDHGPLPVPLACACIHQAALGLQHAHERGLVHRDVKPANLMVVSGGVVSGGVVSGAGTPAATHDTTHQIKILDLGLARWRQGAADGTLTDTGVVMGTPDYMAPEQGADTRAADIRSDIYSLGCTFYHLLTGQPPFPGGKLVEKLFKHRENEPAPIAAFRGDVPAEVEQILRTMMAKQPQDRFQTPADVAQILAPWIKEGTSGEAAIRAGRPLKAPEALHSTVTGVETPAPARPALADVSIPRRHSLVRLGLAVVAAGLIAALVYAAVIIVLPARDGVLTVEVMEADVEVRVGDNVVTINSAKLGKIELRPGKHTLVVRRGQEELFTREFTLKSGGVEAIHAKWTPRPLGTSPFGTSPLGTSSVVQLHGLVAQPAALPDGTAWQMESVLPRGWILALAWDKTGRQLAVGSGDGQVRLFDAASGRLLSLLSGHAEKITDVAWQPGSAVLASASKDGAVALWQTTDGRLLAKSDKVSPVLALHWRPQGDLLATAHQDGAVRLWTVSNGLTSHGLTLAATHRLHDKACQTVGFSSTGKWLASGGADGRLCLWNMPQNRAGVVLDSFRPGSRLGWEPNQDRVTYSRPDRMVVRLDADSDKTSALFQFPNDNPPRLAWSPDGRQLVIGNQQGDLYVWNSANEKLEAVKWRNNPLWIGGAVSAVCWSPDSQRLAWGGEENALIIADGDRRPRPLFRGALAFRAVAWSPDGRRLATGSLPGPDCGGFMAVWNGADGRLEDVVVGEHGMTRVEWFPDSRRVGYCSWHGPQFWDIDPRPEPGDLAPRVRKSTDLPASPLDFRAHETGGSPWMMGLSPDGAKLVTGHWNYALLWDTADLSRSKLSPTHSAWFLGHVVWDRQSRHVATTTNPAPLGASPEDTLRVWDRNGKFIAEFQGTAPAFSPDGGVLAFRRGQTLRFWDVTARKELPETIGGLAARELDWHPKGDRLAGSGDITRIVFRNKKPKHKMLAPRHLNSWAFWSPAGGQLASVSAHDGLLHVWNADGVHQWSALPLAGNEALSWRPEGTVLRRSPGADKCIVYLIASGQGKIDNVSAVEFWQRAPHLAPAGLP